MKAKVALGLVVVMILLYPLLMVQAHHTNPPDRNDTRGMLDVRRVKTWGKLRRPGFTIVTFRRWSIEQMWDHGQALINIDTFGTRRADYYILIRSTGSGLSGTLWRDRPRRDRRVSKVAVWRPNRRSIGLRIPLRKMRKNRTPPLYSWFAQTLFTSDRCRRVCFDRVPNRGRIKESKPQPIPSTPIPTTPPP